MIPYSTSRRSVAVPPAGTRNAYDPDVVFDFVVEFKHKHDGNSPTLREICDGLQISSTSMAHRALADLHKQGRIRVDTSRARGIIVVGGRWTYNGT